MTATITGTLKTNTGQPLSRVNLVFVLTGAYDVVGSSVIANSPYRTKTDTSGTFSVVLNVNEDGLLGTYYKLQIPDVGASIPFTIPTGTTTADIIDLVDVSAASVSATALIVIVENYLSDAATITTVDDADMVWVWDDSADGLRQITYANFTDGLGGSSLPSSTDGQLLVSNAGTYASVTMSGGATIDNTGAVTLSTTALNSWLSGKTTDNLSQGSTNKYYADALVTTYIKAMTAKAAIVAGDKLAIMDSEASDAPKYATASVLATYMQSALAATFAAASHTHAASDVTSGVLDNARVNWGAPSAIGTTAPAAVTGTTGAFNTSLTVGTTATNTTQLTSYGRGQFHRGLYFDSIGRFAFVPQAQPSPDYAGVYVIGSAFRYVLAFDSAGNVGFNTTAPAAPIHHVVSKADTAVAIEMMRFEAQSSGTPAAGFGQQVLFTGKSSATAGQNMFALNVLWSVATHASRAAKAQLVGYDQSGAVTFLELTTDGSGAGTIKQAQISDYTATMGDSTKDPTADAPADWIEVQTDGTTRYIPVYAA